MRFDLVRQRQLPSVGRQAAASFSGNCGNPSSRWWVRPPIGLIEFPVELQLQFRLRHRLCLRLRHFSNCSRWEGDMGKRAQSGCQLISFLNLLCPILLAGHFHLYFQLSGFLSSLSPFYFFWQRADYVMKYTTCGTVWLFMVVFWN